MAVFTRCDGCGANLVGDTRNVYILACEGIPDDDLVSRQEGAPYHFCSFGCIASFVARWQRVEAEWAPDKPPYDAYEQQIQRDIEKHGRPVKRNWLARAEETS